MCDVRKTLQNFELALILDTCIHTHEIVINIEIDIRTFHELFLPALNII